MLMKTYASRGMASYISKPGSMDFAWAPISSLLTERWRISRCSPARTFRRESIRTCEVPVLPEGSLDPDLADGKAGQETEHVHLWSIKAAGIHNIAGKEIALEI